MLAAGIQQECQQLRGHGRTCVMYLYRSGPPLARMALDVLICRWQHASHSFYKCRGLHPSKRIGVYKVDCLVVRQCCTHCRDRLTAFGKWW